MLAVAALLAGCARETPLEGERLDPRALSAEGPTAAAENRAPPIALPAPVNHAAWTHRGGGPTHVIGHAALSSQIAPLWAVQIGQGDDRRFRITADPVVAEGRAFTLDAHATVAATARDGTPLWRRDLRPAWAGRGAASGGGLAYAEGRLYVTSGYGQLVALQAATGDVLWTKRFDAPVTAPPTVRGSRVYAIATDSTAWALDAATGKVLWQRTGAPSAAGMVGGAAPAATERMVFLPFPSGEVAGLMPANGVELWRSQVAGRRLGRAHAGVSDISGDPVVVGGTVYVGNRSGRVVALDADTGEQRWSAREGALDRKSVV